MRAIIGNNHDYIIAEHVSRVLREHNKLYIYVIGVDMFQMIYNTEWEAQNEQEYLLQWLTGSLTNSDNGKITENVYRLDIPADMTLYKYREECILSK